MKQLLVLAGLAFMTCSLSAQSAQLGQAGYKIGHTATDFELMNVNDELVSLKGTFPDANGYIVIFTCNHCPYAVMYEDRIIELNETFAPEGYPVIAINPNDPDVVAEDSFEKMKERAEEKGFNFPYLFDANQTIFPQYGALKTPHVYLLDANLVVKYIGAIDDNPRNAAAVEQHYVQDAIRAIQAGQYPDPATTKAVGCRIKVKS